jgi:MFS family permease
MTCDEYYQHHPEPLTNMRDRCDIPAIGSSTSKSVALLGFTTTLFGVPNLFLTGHTMKKFGIKTALLIQVSWIAARLLIQNTGVEVGKATGIIIIQCSQMITIIGGPVGYLLALNSYITEVVSSSERTPSLGRLQGWALFGSAIGFLLGGQLVDWFSIKAPFRVALVLFTLCSLYVFFALPWTPPNTNVNTRTSQGLTKFFGPLKKFAPQKWVHKDGTVKREYGALLLGIGVFFGILATGYITVLLQMYSTDVLGFTPGENGALVSLNFFLRGLFLAVAFPKIIATGRKWLRERKKSKSRLFLDSSTETLGDIPTEPNDMAAVDEAEQEPITGVQTDDENISYDFDLFYCKFSLILDGILTGGATFVRQGWQIYIVAILIPFAAGTGSASKGTIIQMCPPSERVEALSGITLIEMIARLSTSM